MFLFDREKLFDGLRDWRGVVLPNQVKGLNFLIDCIEQDKFMTRLDWVAYALATTQHETAYTFLPVHEYGGRQYFINRYGGHTRKGRELGNDTPEEGAIYAGRGDVQLTGESNYERMEVALRREYPELIERFEQRTGKNFDLTVGDQPNDIRDPDNAQDPEIAYAIMSYGMRKGSFTGKKLSDYFNSKRDWFNARRIINGTDHAGEIGEKGKRWLQILEQSVIRDDTKINDKITEPVVITAVPKPNKIETVDQTDVLGDSANDTLPDSLPKTPPVSQPQTEVTPAQTQPTQPIPITTETVNAPLKDGSTGTVVKTTILGIAVPGFVAVAIKAGTDLIAQGFISSAQIGDFVLNLVRENQKYILWIVVALAVLLGVKKVCKQITLWLQMWFAADPKSNNVEIKPQ